VLCLPSRIGEACLLELVEDGRNHALHHHVDDAGGDPAVPVIVGEIADTRAGDAGVFAGVDGLDDVCSHEGDCALKALLGRARRIIDAAIEENVLLRGLAFDGANCCAKAVAPIAVGEGAGAASRVVVDLVACVDANEGGALDAGLIPDVTVVGVLQNVEENLRSDVLEESLADELQAQHVRIARLLHVN